MRFELKFTAWHVLSTMLRLSFLLQFVVGFVKLIFSYFCSLHSSVKLWASAFGGEIKSIAAKYSGSQLLQKVNRAVQLTNTKVFCYIVPWYSLKFTLSLSWYMNLVIIQYNQVLPSDTTLCHILLFKRLTCYFRLSVLGFISSCGEKWVCASVPAALCYHTHTHTRSHSSSHTHTHTHSLR